MTKPPTKHVTKPKAQVNRAPASAYVHPNVVRSKRLAMAVAAAGFAPPPQLAD